MNPTLKAVCIAVCMFNSFAVLADEEAAENTLPLGNQKESFCVHKNIHGGHARQHIVSDTKCDENKPNHTRVKLPYEVSSPADAQVITKLIIAIHGAQSKFEGIYDAITGTAGDNDEVLVVAPQFLHEHSIRNVRDADRQCPHPNNPNKKIVCPDILRWENSEKDPLAEMAGWEEGEPSLEIVDIGVKISSFDVMDEFIRRFAANHPLTEIVIAGFSRGAQFVNRYSIGTRIENEFPTISFRYAFGAPGSHMHFSEFRHRYEGGGQWTDLNDFGTCPYNNYRYGTLGIAADHYMHDMLDASWNEEQKREALLNNIKPKKRLLLAGELDTLKGDTNCAAEAQAPFGNRTERTQVYFYHLWKTGVMETVDGQPDGAPANVGCCIIPNVDHDAKIFGRPAMTKFWKTGAFDCGSATAAQCHPLKPPAP